MINSWVIKGIKICKIDTSLHIQPHDKLFKEVKYIYQSRRDSSFEDNSLMDLNFYGISGYMKDFYILDDLLYNYGCTGSVKVASQKFVSLVVSLTRFNKHDFKEFRLYCLDWDDFQIYVNDMWNRNAKFVHFYI